MCGIAGIYNFNNREVDRDLLERMTSRLNHRGPDGAGFYAPPGPIGLGHRRLSIIDLTGGVQPMGNEDGNIQIVFNGEIYNFVELRRELEYKGHTFATRSDTEVIVHAYEQWGLDCIDRLNGIFAFSLWDRSKQQLVLARDHLGVKPLYYLALPHQLLFASEIKSLLMDPNCPREVDPQALNTLFTLRYVPSPDTLFRSIKKLPPGHLMVVRSNSIEIKRYWKWIPQISSTIDEQTAVERYQTLLKDVVQLQMRSDVPVGLFLSSGIDSGVLLALMSEQTGTPIRTFTIGFQEGEVSNETDDARKMAERFGADHEEMIIAPQDYEAYYERYLFDLEEPVGNESAAAFYFVSRLASRKVKVVLTGQGADEPWAGYHRYIGVKLSGAYSRLPQFLTHRVLRPLVERFSSNERLTRGALSLDEPDVLARFVKMYSFYSSSMKERLFKPWVNAELDTDGYHARMSLHRLQADVEMLDPLTQMLYIDTRANLPDDLLMVGDKTSMANSLEARVPFLDRRLVEFIETLPSDFKLRRFKGKYLHKKALEKWLPKKTVYQKKKGFANPIDAWLRKGMRRYIGDCLLSEGAAVNRYFNHDYIRQIVLAHEKAGQNYMRHINLLLAFELWHQQFLNN